MTRNEQLEKWLSNRQRTYADGMELFNAFSKGKHQEQLWELSFPGTGESSHFRSPLYTISQYTD